MNESSLHVDVVQTVDELSEDLNRARDNINDAIYCLEKVVT